MQTESSLFSLKVLVTRPVTLANNLLCKINQAGFIAEHLPVIEFKPAVDQRNLEKKLETLPLQDLAIFISQTAVQYGMQKLLALYGKAPNIPYAAIGPGTKQALASFGLDNIIMPKGPPYESETLLEHEALQNVSNKKIMLFKGNAGRDYLSQTLQARGAKVEKLECYQVCLPEFNIAERLNIWQQQPIHVILSTSAQSLENLKLLVGNAVWGSFKSCPMVVVGLRMLKLAANLGVSQIVVAKGADDASLIEALINLRDQLRDQIV